MTSLFLPPILWNCYLLFSQKDLHHPKYTATMALVPGKIHQSLYGHGIVGSVEDFRQNLACWSILKLLRLNLPVPIISLIRSYLPGRTFQNQHLHYFSSSNRVLTIRRLQARLLHFSTYSKMTSLFLPPIMWNCHLLFPPKSSAPFKIHCNYIARSWANTSIVADFKSIHPKLKPPSSPTHFAKRNPHSVKLANLHILALSWTPV